MEENGQGNCYNVKVGEERRWRGMMKGHKTKVRSKIKLSP
jgi:hypothetical protein